jgi:hypothetical protein
MVGAERFLEDGERPLAQRLRLLVLTLSFVQRRQVVDTRGDTERVGAERPLPDDQRSLV